MPPKNSSNLLILSSFLSFFVETMFFVSKALQLQKNLYSKTKHIYKGRINLENDIIHTNPTGLNVWICRRTVIINSIYTSKGTLHVQIEHIVLFIGKALTRQIHSLKTRISRSGSGTFLHQENFKVKLHYSMQQVNLDLHKKSNSCSKGKY